MSGLFDLVLFISNSISLIGLLLMDVTVAVTVAVDVTVAVTVAVCDCRWM